VVRDKVVDLEIVHISSTHTTPQKFTPEAGQRVKGAQKNDMYFFLLALVHFCAVLRHALNASRRAGLQMQWNCMCLSRVQI
jgi:hypothetical protein